MTESTEIRAIIVDDEPHALRRLGALLAEHRDISIIDRCSDGDAALESIAKQQPDVVFVDIDMPEIDGFDVVSPFLDENGPEIVFVTAYDEFALRAFDARAIDYVLKPIERPRLAETLERLRRRMNERGSAERAASLEETVNQLRTARAGQDARSKYRDFWIKHQGRLVRVPQSDIEWIEADRDYVRFHTDARALILRETMQNLEKRLDPEMFMRVHRSSIVNITRIVRSHVTPSGFRVLHMQNEAQVRVGRMYARDVSQLLKRNQAGG